MYAVLKKQSSSAIGHTGRNVINGSEAVSCQSSLVRQNRISGSRNDSCHAFLNRLPELTVQRLVLAINNDDKNVAKNLSKYLEANLDEKLAGTMQYEEGQLKGMVENDTGTPQMLRIFGHGGYLNSLISHNLEDISATKIAEALKPYIDDYVGIELIACRSKDLAKELAKKLPGVPVTGYDGSVLIRSGKPTVYDHERMEALSDSAVRYTYIRRGDELSSTKG